MFIFGTSIHGQGTIESLFIELYQRRLVGKFDRKFDRFEAKLNIILTKIDKSKKVICLTL